MTQPLTKEELIRGAWITALRMEGHRQIRWEPYGHFDDRVCAGYLLREIAGVPNRLDTRSIYYDRRACWAAGLSTWQGFKIMFMNDGLLCRQHTFSEIADVVEGWFKK
jgi:hypothetical protein